MKTFITALALFSAFSAMANVAVYKNKSGCTVEVENRRNGVVLNVTKNGKNEIIGYANDFSFADFSYCADKAVKIDFFEGRTGTGLMISCSEHQNDHAITRGRVDIDIIGGELKKISIDGQVKKLFGWKQDTQIECLDLVKH